MKLTIHHLDKVLGRVEAQGGQPFARAKAARDGTFGHACLQHSLLHDRTVTGDAFAGHSVTTSPLQRLPLRQSNFRRALPLFPTAVGQLPLRQYGVVVSSMIGMAWASQATVRGGRNVELPAYAALSILFALAGHEALRYVGSGSARARAPRPTKTAARRSPSALPQSRFARRP